MREIRWGRLLRRGAAFGLATLALWMLLLGAGAATGTAGGLGGSGAFVTAALRTELGDPGEMPLWLRLAADQSALFSANLDRQEEGTVTAKVSPTPEPLPDAQPVPDSDDVAETPPAAIDAPYTIVEQTLVPSKNKGYVTGAGMYLYNRSGLEVDLVRLLAKKPDLGLFSGAAGPQILIIHTHTTEAYTPSGVQDTYTASDYARTTDEKFNMIRIGDEIAQVFTSMGLNVIHDRELYDYPKYNGAYGRSKASMEAWLEKYPTIRVILDVHRDGLMDDKGTVYKPVTTVDGVKTAQVMLVAGSDADGGDHPLWRENLSVCVKVQKNMDTLFPTLARPMTLRKSTYNQELAPGSFLVEVGSHGNTLEEALAGARDFARCAGAVFLSLLEEE